MLKSLSACKNISKFTFFYIKCIQMIMRSLCILHVKLFVHDLGICRKSKQTAYDFVLSGKSKHTPISA